MFALTTMFAGTVLFWTGTLWTDRQSKAVRFVSPDQAADLADRLHLQNVAVAVVSPA